MRIFSLASNASRDTIWTPLWPTALLINSLYRMTIQQHLVPPHIAYNAKRAIPISAMNQMSTTSCRQISSALLNVTTAVLPATNSAMTRSTLVWGAVRTIKSVASTSRLLISIIAPYATSTASSVDRMPLALNATTAIFWTPMINSASIVLLTLKLSITRIELILQKQSIQPPPIKRLL